MLKTQRSTEATGSVYESRLPGALARLKRWLVSHHMTLMAIADTPHSIALGSAIGIFFGFTPLYPLKTLLSIGVAWVSRCNKIAAAVAVTLHDFVHWHVFSRLVWPIYWPAFVGSLFLAIPSAILVYFLMRFLIIRARPPQKAN